MIWTVQSSCVIGITKSANIFVIIIRTLTIELVGETREGSIENHKHVWTFVGNNMHVVIIMTVMRSSRKEYFTGPK